ncbi:hypothetical protein ElyMa_004049300 [Elysia marginata]|uniref:Uncharacterized protein n=1 Tax=Elysia marginata TaxID=1093978 RepID=A0AAV4G6A1_9GAST|nr:hypothetical protein ElyMa_004049300 [Elysia marginata]
MAPGVEACFIVEKSILPGQAGTLSGLDICLAAEAVAGRNTIEGAQKTAGCWRIYCLTKAARSELIIGGLCMGGQSLTILDKNPFIVSRPDSLSTKLIVGNIPISVSNAEIGDALKDLGVEDRSPIREETYRDKDGGLTRFKTGRRFVYITLPTKPLPKTTKVGGSFFAYLYYREQQKVGAGESRGWETGGKTTKEHVEGSSVESMEGETHPESHRVEPNQTSEFTQRSRASLPKKHTTLERFHKKITRSRSLSTTGGNKRHLSAETINNSDKKQKGDQNCKQNTQHNENYQVESEVDWFDKITDS